MSEVQPNASDFLISSSRCAKLSTALSLLRRPQGAVCFPMAEDQFDTSELLGDFVEDARGHLTKLDEALLQFEHAMDAGVPEPAFLEAVLGPLHTLKGNAGMMGFTKLQSAVHEFESVIKRITTREVIPSERGLDALFRLSALLHRAVERLAAEKKEVEIFSDLPALLQAITQVGPMPRPAQTQARDDAAFKAAPADWSLAGESQMIKIDFKRLDRLLNLVGELVMYRTALSQAQADLITRVGDPDLTRELSDISQVMGKTVAELQEAIMEARLLPMRQVLNPFPRLVRDLARQRGKRVNLHIRGADTELDKTVIDKIGEPLLHLVRNAVDHGIEPVSVRVREGKPETGNITISAMQESNNVVITVEDDGGGLDTQAILAKARAQGLVEAERKLTDAEIHELIFHKGFSTAESVTEVSGRGVGMDVVREVIQTLGGVIEIDTIRHMGTKFTIKLPLTLAIISALLVEVGGETYAVPTNHVVESVRLAATSLHVVNGREVMRLRDRVLPMIKARPLFSLPEAANRDGYVVVLGRGERRVGLVVDRLLGQLDIVIKGLDDLLVSARYIAGASVLGDGRVVLIIDVSRLLAVSEAVL